MKHRRAWWNTELAAPTAALLALTWLASPARGESPSLDDLDASWKAAVESVAEKCESLGRPELAAKTRRLQPRRHRRATRLYLAPRDKPAPAAKDDDLLLAWRRRVTAMRQARAEQLRAAATELAQDEPAQALQLCYEALHLDPQSAKLRAVLGYERDGAQWNRRGFYGAPPALSDEGIRVDASQQRAKPRLGLAPHWRIRSAHFEVLSEPGRREGEALAAEIEALFDVWSQLFTRLWIDSSTLQRRLQAGEPATPPLRRHRVVLFRDRQRYLAVLRAKEPRIGMSLGYYLPADKTSYFYWDPSQPRDTWRHEVAHQLFNEVRRAAPSAGLRRNFWLIEGIAMYLESLRIDPDDAGAAIVGGPGVDRLQFARLRMAPDRQSLTQLVSLGRIQLQGMESVSTLYSNAAGVTCFLMDGQQRRRRKACVDLLSLVYQGRDRETSLFEQTGLESPERFVEQYHAFLRAFDDDDLADLGAVRNLCLRNTSVSAHALAKIDGRQLRWLDAAGRPYTDAALRPLLQDARHLEKLNLDGTPLTGELMEAASGTLADRWPRLVELDLSNTQATTGTVRQLAPLPLEVLWLTRTRVTPAVIDILQQFRKLRMLNLGGIDGITPQLAAPLAQQLPQLERVDFAQ